MGTPMTGLLLAGGSSSRMGRDKSRLNFQGEPLAARVARLLGECCSEVLVASGDGLRAAWLGLPQVKDAEPGSGPLAGIVAGLGRAAHPLVAVAAADMPFASPAVYRLLAGMLRGEDVAVPVSERGLEPLHAVYSKDAAIALKSALESGVLAVHAALGGLRVLEVTGESLATADPGGRFAFNVNYPTDLA